MSSLDKLLERFGTAWLVLAIVAIILGGLTDELALKALDGDADRIYLVLFIVSWVMLFACFARAGWVWRWWVKGGKDDE